MRARRRVRFITGGETTPAGTPTGRGRMVGWGTGPAAPPARRRPAPSGFECRMATAQERDEWPVLREEQCFWLACCRRCPEWRYGRRKADVRRWGVQHRRDAHYPGRGDGKAVPPEARPGQRRRPTAGRHHVVITMTVRPSTRQDRHDWPVLAADNGQWLVECSCGAWAYGARRADVMGWGSEHKTKCHSAPGPAQAAPPAAVRVF